MSPLDNSHLIRLDGAVDEWFEGVRGKRQADSVFYAASEAANHSLLWHAIVWIRAAIIPEYRRSAPLISLALVVESCLVNGPIKMIFRRARPDNPDPRPHHLRQPRTSSFPSGHATSAFCAAALIGHRSKAKPLVYVLASIVALSRIHVKIHHASDVIFGALLGASFGAAARHLIFRRR